VKAPFVMLASFLLSAIGAIIEIEARGEEL